jgi:hypothetical protein
MKLGSKNARLIDALYQVQLSLIIGLAYAAFAWWLYSGKPELEEIKQTLKANNATLEAIRERIGDEKAWQRLEQPLKETQR